MKKTQISSAEEFCNTFLGGVAAAEGSETCTKSSEVQGGGGDVAGVPKGVPFPPAEKEHKFSQQAPPSSFQLNIACEKLYILTPSHSIYFLNLFQLFIKTKVQFPKSCFRLWHWIHRFPLSLHQHCSRWGTQFTGVITPAYQLAFPFQNCQ